MDKKFVFIFVSVFLLCAGLARALDFNATLNPITNTANMFEQAKYELSIHNSLNQQDIYTLDFISDPTWSITTEPPSDYFTGMDVPAGQTKTTMIILKPNIPMTYGAYEIKLNIKSAATGLEQQVRVPVVVTVPDQQQQYAMTMTLAADVPAEVDPRQPMKITISVENKMPVKRSGLKVVVKDALGLVNQEQNISVDPLGKNVFDINIEFNPIQSPAADTLTISLLTANDELIKRIDNKNFDIIAYSPLNESESVRKSFLKTTTTITVSNSGNALGTKLVTRKVGFFQNIFLKTKPTAKWAEINGKRYLGWQVTVPPQSAVQIIMAVSFRGLVLLLVVIVLLAAAYFYLKPPIEVRKRAGITKTREGGISELKVILNVKNTSSKSIQDVKVVDSVPDIADIEENFQAGTIKPDNITKNIANGTLVKWNLGRFEAYEERVISYRIKSKLTIIGYFRLHSAVVKFISNNKESKVRSNSVQLHIKKEEFGLE
jgi:hypothetical protein